jgi:hypothetical protein
MAKSDRKFSRWLPHDRSTWSMRVFHKYDDEISLIWEANVIANAFVYSRLKVDGAEWADSPTKHFTAETVHLNRYCSLTDWSDSLNLFNNWVNLNVILTAVSNLETYLASVIAMALESDPGVVLGVSKAIDGASVLKHKREGIFDAKEQIEACTRGDWSSRLDAFQKLFGKCPDDFRSNHSALEELRSIRNRIGHAFGRDIDAARLHGVLETLPMERVSREHALKLRRHVWAAARSVDKFLLANHIGDFEAVRFYHHLYPSLHKHVSTGQRAVYLKKEIGKSGPTRGKVYCKGLVEYWESL